MHFSTDQQDATTVFRLKEQVLDSRNAGQLKAEFLILSQPDIDTLIIDLTEVRHVDSAGLSALLLAHRQMASHDGEVRLVGASAEVQSLLRVTQLDRIFPQFNTVNEALDAEPSLGGEDDDALEDEQDLGSGSSPRASVPLGPGAPSANEIRAGAIASGGSFGAAAISKIMITPYEEELENLNLLSFGDDEDYDDEDDDLDEDDEFEEDEEFAEDDDLDEEDDVEEVEGEAAVEEPEADDIVEDDDFEDDDFDDEELEEDEDDDY